MVPQAVAVQIRGGKQSDGRTYVHIDAAQMGVGGITSWGAEPLSAYMLPPAPCRLSFLMVPVE